MIFELSAALAEGRPVNPNFRPLLNQMMIAFGAIQLQEIGWRAEWSMKKD
jgi:hypothetical protein